MYVCFKIVDLKDEIHGTGVGEADMQYCLS